MIYLPIAILFFVSIFVIFRLFEKYKVDNLQAIVINYIVAAFTAYFVAEDASDLNAIIERPDFQPTVILGVMFMLSFLVFALSSQKAGVAITAISSKVSVVIPVLVGIAIYPSDSMSLTIILGLILTILSLLLIFKQPKGQPIDKKMLIFPVLLFLMNGANDSLMKHIRIGFQEHLEQSFNNQVITIFILFSASFVIGSLILFVRQLYQPYKFTLKTIVAGVILGLFNFASSLSLYIAMGHFNGNFFFPVFNISVVMVSVFVGILFFKEKFHKVNYIGLAGGIGAILLIALSEL